MAPSRGVEFTDIQISPMDPSWAALNLPILPNDPLDTLPIAVRDLLRTPQRAGDALRLAKDKLNAYVYKDVPSSWRRLYTDASIIKAVELEETSLNRLPERRRRIRDLEGQLPQTDQTQRDIKSLVTESNVNAYRKFEQKDSWDSQAEVIATLDMALIVAGAAGREMLVEELINCVGNTRVSLRQVIETGRSSQHLATDCVTDPSESSSNHEFEPTNELPPRKRQRLSNAGQHHDEDIFRLNFSQSPTITQPIQRLHEPAPSALSSQPIILTGILDSWPAMDLWRHRSYLLAKTSGGRRLVPVEIGRSYVDEGWGQRIMSFTEFLDRISDSEGRGSSSDPSRSHKIAEYGPFCSKDNSATVEGPPRDTTLYLAQHDLFSQIPSLRNDISIPDYIWLSNPSRSSSISSCSPTPQPDPLLNAWLGPASTVSPLHTDPHYNILCQVIGAKYVRLYAPTETSNLYPRGIEEGGINMGNTSQVDVEDEAADIEEHFPNFKNAKYVEGILGQGEALYIPKGWWHYVRSLSMSFSVSFWWD